MRLNDLGGPENYSIYPFGWAMAGNTPFKRYKGNTYAGGIRAPLIIRWPEGIKAKGEIRRQFYHAVDLTPTLLELIGLPLPKYVNGFEQMPLHGTSMTSSLKDNQVSTQKKVQYFETTGHRAIWSEGWKAVTFHNKGDNFETEVWELYYLDDDMAEIDNLADQYPEKLNELINLWWHEAEQYGVLPLDDMSGMNGSGWWPEQKKSWTLYQDAVIPHHFKAGPRLFGISHRIKVRLVHSAADDGVIVSDGGKFGGWTLFIHQRRLHYTANYYGDSDRISTLEAIPNGSLSIRVEVIRTDVQQGLVRLYVNDRPAGEGPLTRFRQYNFTNEPLEVGRDSQTPVDQLYQSPNIFPGAIKDVVIETASNVIVDQNTAFEELMGSQ